MRTYCHIALLAAQASLGRGPADTTVPKVVFVKGTEVFTVSADGTNLTQLTRDNRFKLLPRWSPDGGSIAYVAQTATAMGQFTLIAKTGEKLADFPIRPEEAHIGGMRSIESLEWLGGTRVIFGGSANPWNCEQVVLDTTTGKEVESQLGTCGTFVRSPDGKLTAYWAPEGMGFSKEERRENLNVNDAVVYPVAITPANTLQFLSNPAWSADSQRVALIDRDVNTGVTSLTVLDGRPDHATSEHRGRHSVARPAPVLMHAPLGSDLDERMEVQWVGNLVLVSKEGGAALFQADPAHGTIQSATAEALQFLAAPRAQAAQLKSKAEDLVRKLGGSDFDIWTGPQSTAPN